MIIAMIFYFLAIMGIIAVIYICGGGDKESFLPEIY
jgi:hypothetical protein